MPPILANLLGILAILAIAFLLSVGKRRIRLRVVAAAFALQALMAFLVLATSGGRLVIQGMADGVAALLSPTRVRGPSSCSAPTTRSPILLRWARCR